MLRVLVVDDSALYRQMVRNVLRDIANVEVVGAAKNGKEAIDKVAELKPDVITLDYEMPELNGIQVLRRLRHRGDKALAIMLSSYTEEGAKVTTDALLQGAFDFIQKPTTSDPSETRAQLCAALEEKLASIAVSRDAQNAESAKTLAREIADSSAARSKRSKKETDPSDHLPACDLVVIGASTGGPIVVRSILEKLPGDLAVPVIVVQHMPTRFTAALARRLNETCQLDVVETANGCRFRPGAVYVAAGGYHTKIVRRNRYVLANLTEDPRENGCRPAIDYTLRSAVKVFGGRVCSVILTGMGHDGLAGCQQVKQAGGHVIAQHPMDCAVYGMPKAIVENDLADKILRTEQIAEAIRGLRSG